MLRRCQRAPVRVEAQEAHEPARELRLLVQREADIQQRGVGRLRRADLCYERHQLCAQLGEELVAELLRHTLLIVVEPEIVGVGLRLHQLGEAAAGVDYPLQQRLKHGVIRRGLGLAPHGGRLVEQLLICYVFVHRHTAAEAQGLLAQLHDTLLSRRELVHMLREHAQRLAGFLAVRERVRRLVEHGESLAAGDICTLRRGCHAVEIQHPRRVVVGKFTQFEVSEVLSGFFWCHLCVLLVCVGGPSVGGGRRKGSSGTPTPTCFM